MRPTEPARAVTLAWTAAGVLASLWYFGWLLQPGRAGAAVLFGLLLAADLFNGFHAFSFWLTSLRRPRDRPFEAPAAARVDVLIPTLDEPLEILARTVGAARRVRGAEVRVVVLDDGARPAVQRLARRLGADYLARPGSAGAKAGNLNAGLRETAVGGAPYVCVFDADHVPDPAFLERTLGYFVDARVGLVQTPQVYANAARGRLTHGAAQQQAVFFGPVCGGRDGWGSTFCCGTNFVARREALERTGGFPEDSVTEDIVLSAELVGLGYELAYVPEPLAVGLGPEDGRSYLAQQLRWATGCLDLLLRRPRLWRPLSWGQRWQYLVATSYWLAGWSVLVYLSLPAVRLLFGWQPVQDGSGAFAAHFLPYFLISIVNLARYTAGSYTLAGLAMTWGSFAIHVRATVRVVLGRPLGFAVTAKRALPGVPWGGFAANLAAVAVLLGACAGALAQGATPERVNNVAFALIDVLLVGAIVVFAAGQARATARAAAVPWPRAARLRPRPAPAHRTLPARHAADAQGVR